jgi:hypothetical protein
MSIQIGDKVAYNQSFMNRAGQYALEVLGAAGIVTRIEGVLAVVTWDRRDIPNQAEMADLKKVKAIVEAESTEAPHARPRRSGERGR